MGKNNKNNQDQEQPTVIKPDEDQEQVTSNDEITGNDAEDNSAEADANTSNNSNDKADAVAAEKLDSKSAKTTKVAKASAPELEERRSYKVIVIKKFGSLKVGDEKSASGNVAKSLIKKGLVKLKN